MAEPASATETAAAATSNGVHPDAARLTEEFVSVAVHDLRNPIAVVRAMGQMAQRQAKKGDFEAANRRIDGIVEQTERLSELLEMFLDAARIEAQRLPLRCEQADLRQLVEPAVARARLFSAEHGQRDVEVDVPAGLIGEWDTARVGRSIRALVENALLYGDHAQPVHVRAERRGDTVVLMTSGGGPGPTDAETPRLFQRFFRGHAAAEVGHSGSGLGLFVARGIARAHGGDVRRAPHGAADAFELELPLLPAV